MKTKQSIWLFSCMFIIAFCTHAQCPSPGDIQLDSQAAVNAFIKQYPTCTAIEGGLKLSGDIEDITALENLTEVKGLNIENTFLTSLEGLHNLTAINGDLRIGPNASLTEVTALSQITTVNEGNGGIIIQNNPLLTNLNGLHNISTARYITVSENESLINLEGLQGLETLGLRLQISHVYNLQSLVGLDNLVSVDNLTIQYCPVLETLDGLNELATIGSYLSIHNNPQLSYCHIEPICAYLDSAEGGVNIIHNSPLGCSNSSQILDFCEGFTECPEPGDITFENQFDIDFFLAQYPDCNTIQGNVTILDDEGTNITNLSGLQNINTITGSLTISSNYGLSTLEGLDNLEQVGGTLMIVSNGVLESLEALNNLTNLNNSELRIENNGILTSLVGLDNIAPSTISNLILQSSQNLTTCNVESICNYVASLGNSYTISGNATNCNSDVEIIDSCEGILTECPPDFTFLTQAEIDHYKVRYPNCTVIQGDLNIGGTSYSDIDNLTPLDHITNINGDLRISKTSLTTLHGLENITQLNGVEIVNNNDLESIEGFTNLSFLQSLEIISNASLVNLDGIGPFSQLETLRIILNPSLINLSALNSLHSIEKLGDGWLEISQNENLSNLSGLESLSYVDGFVKIQDNVSLQNIDALSGLQAVGFNLTISNNPILESFNLINLTTVGSLLYIGNNPLLQSLGGLENLATAPSIDILDNHSLTNLEGLSGLTNVNTLEVNNNHSLENLYGISDFTLNRLSIKNNDSLIDIGALETITELTFLDIDNNANLVSLDGLSNLTAIHGDLLIQHNESLVSIEAFANLGIVNRIWILNNNALESLSGLDNIDPNNLSLLVLESSVNLSTCNVPSICTYLSNGGNASISENAQGCQSTQEILDVCALGTHTFIAKNHIYIYPNPMDNWIYIETAESLTISQVFFYDVNGKILIEKMYTSDPIDVSALSKGVYFLQFETNQGRFVYKFVK